MRYHDQLSKNTNLKLPSKEILQYDQRVFTKFLEKVRKAHLIEVKWLRERIRIETQKYVEDYREKTLKAATIEIRNIMRQFDDTRKQLLYSTDKIKK